MKVLIFGAGAVGGYYGAKLAAAGVDVNFIARGRHLEAMEKSGLKVQSIDGDIDVDVKVFNDPLAVGQVDLAIISVKSQDTNAAIEQLSSTVDKNTILMSLQNGVENEKRLSQAFPENPIIGGVSYIASELVSPGVISHTALGNVTMGIYPKGAGPLLEKVASVFEKGGIKVEREEDIMASKWRKLVWNASFNPVSILLPVSTDLIANNEHSADTVRTIMWEVLAVAACEGYAIDPVLIERSIAWTAGMENVKTSMLQDFDKGKELEIEDLLGVVVRKGEEHCVPTPVSKLVYELVKAKAKER